MATNFSPSIQQQQFSFQYGGQFQKFSPVKNGLMIIDNLSSASTSTQIPSMIQSQECQGFNKSQNRRFSTQTQLQFNKQTQQNSQQTNAIFSYNNNLQSQQLDENKNNTQARRFSEFQQITPPNIFKNINQIALNQNNSQHYNQKLQQQQQLKPQLLLYHHNSEKSNSNANFNQNYENLNSINQNQNNMQEECNFMSIHQSNPNFKITEFESCTEIEDDLETKIEIDVKPKRKVFVNVEDKKKFVEDYRKKIKTELCKNFQLKGQCKFGDKCSFAHGYNELKEKTHLHTNYKTKPCKQYFYSGYCAYGYRCQYLHSEIKYLPEFKIFLQKLYQEKNLQLNLNNNASHRKFSQKLQWLSNMTNNIEDNALDAITDLNVDDYLLSLKLKRLQVFKKIEEKEGDEQKVQYINDDEFQNYSEQILKFNINNEDEFTTSKQSSSNSNNISNQSEEYFENNFYIDNENHEKALGNHIEENQSLQSSMENEKLDF